MLLVTIDAFSGRENPSYVLDGNQSRDLLRDVSRRRQGITDVDEGFTGLGLRGVTVEALSDDAESYGLPERFKVGGGKALDEGGGLELAERLIRGLLENEPYMEPADSPLTVDEALINYFLELLDRPTVAGIESVLDGPEKAIGIRPELCPATIAITMPQISAQTRLPNPAAERGKCTHHLAVLLSRKQP